MSKSISEKKLAYKARLESYLEEYPNILIIGVDNVGSNQMQQVRMAMRGRAVVLMGKNTMIRRIFRDNLEKRPALEELLPHIVGNVGLVFCKDEITEIRDIVEELKVPAAAKTGAIAPCDVFVPAGPTTLDPGQTSFFQALNILTKINRGSIEIMTKVHLVKQGEKVTSSAVALMSKLNIQPFFYGIVVKTVYDNGSVYVASVLDITPEILQGKFFSAVNLIASIGLQIGYPCMATVGHSLANAFQKLLSISLATEYTFEQAQKYKDYLADPSAFAAPAAAEEKPAEEEAKPESSEEESSSGGDGFGLFD
jgi:large subunit ribosomal protein LP0